MSHFAIPPGPPFRALEDERKGGKRRFGDCFQHFVLKTISKNLFLPAQDWAGPGVG